MNPLLGAWLLILIGCLGTCAIALVILAGARLGWWRFPPGRV